MTAKELLSALPPGKRRNAVSRQLLRSPDDLPPQWGTVVIPAGPVEDQARALAEAPMAPPPKRNKYRAKPTVVDGIRFASKREAEYYGTLKLEALATPGMFFLTQVPFTLEGGVKYVADFVVFRPPRTWSDPPEETYQVEVIDVKGMRTPTYRMKRRQVEARYPVTIREV